MDCVMCCRPVSTEGKGGEEGWIDVTGGMENVVGCKRHDSVAGFGRGVNFAKEECGAGSAECHLLAVVGGYNELAEVLLFRCGKNTFCQRAFGDFIQFFLYQLCTPAGIGRVASEINRKQAAVAHHVQVGIDGIDQAAAFT